MLEQNFQFCEKVKWITSSIRISCFLSRLHDVNRFQLWLLLASGSCHALHNSMILLKTWNTTNPYLKSLPYFFFGIQFTLNGFLRNICGNIFLFWVMVCQHHQNSFMLLNISTKCDLISTNIEFLLRCQIHLICNNTPTLVLH